VRDNAVDDVGSISVSVYDIRTVLVAERANSAPFTQIVSIPDVEWNSSNSSRFKRVNERMRLIFRRKHHCDTYRVPVTNVSRGKLTNHALKSAEMRRGDDVQDGNRSGNERHGTRCVGD
jgi:hypothetical protein